MNMMASEKSFVHGFDPEEELPQTARELEMSEELLDEYRNMLALLKGNGVLDFFYQLCFDTLIELKYKGHAPLFLSREVLEELVGLVKKDTGPAIFPLKDMKSIARRVSVSVMEKEPVMLPKQLNKMDNAVAKLLKKLNNNKICSAEFRSKLTPEDMYNLCNGLMLRAQPWGYIITDPRLANVVKNVWKASAKVENYMPNIRYREKDGRLVVSSY